MNNMLINKSNENDFCVLDKTYLCRIKSSIDIWYFQTKLQILLLLKQNMIVDLWRTLLNGYDIFQKKNGYDIYLIKTKKLKTRR